MGTYYKMRNTIKKPVRVRQWWGRDLSSKWNVGTTQLHDYRRNTCHHVHHYHWSNWARMSQRRMSIWGPLPQNQKTVCHSGPRSPPRRRCLPHVLSQRALYCHRNHRWAKKLLVLPQWNFYPFHRPGTGKLYKYKSGDPIPDPLIAVSWKDGANVQWNVVSLQCFQKNTVCPGQQLNIYVASHLIPWDLENLANGITYEYSPTVSLQQRVNKMFSKLKNIVSLNITDKKESALINLLGSYPVHYQPCVSTIVNCTWIPVEWHGWLIVVS